MIVGAILFPVIMGFVQQKIIECTQKDTAQSSSFIAHYLYLLDQPQISEKQIIVFLTNNNRNLDKDYIEKIAKLYCMESKRESINTAVAVAQMALETGFLNFEGSVKKAQNNFAGIGCVRKSAQGNSFATIEEGIRAHIQHLKAYASSSPLNALCVDPRYKFVQKSQFFGKLKTVYDLSETWAKDENYGEKLAKLTGDLLGILDL
jgi:hypothetical protein